MDHWLSLIHPGDRAETSRLLDLLVSGSCNRVKLTHRFGAKNGGYQRFTDVAVVSARDATGRPAKVLGWVDSGQESGSCDG
jgi:hypothetical protein